MHIFVQRNRPEFRVCVFVCVCVYVYVASLVNRSVRFASAGIFRGCFLVCFSYRLVWKLGADLVEIVKDVWRAYMCGEHWVYRPITSLEQLYIKYKLINLSNTVCWWIYKPHIAHHSSLLHSKDGWWFFVAHSLSLWHSDLLCFVISMASRSQQST